MMAIHPMHMTQDAELRALERQPGTNGLWTFVFIDMIIFSLLFVVFLSERGRLPEIFRQSQAHLSFGFGFANALLLLTSSLFMAEAVQAARRGDGARVQRYLTWCLACALLFGVDKLFEYHAKIAAGVDPSVNSFYAFYFFITGVHFIHVVVGMIFIASCRRRALTEAGTQDYRRRIENVGLFWHFVDLLWLFIFPLIYLTGGQ